MSRYTNNKKYGVKNRNLPPHMQINGSIPTNKVLLAKMRESSFHTLTGFAARIGISRAYLSQVLHYKLWPDSDIRFRISKILGCDSSIVFPIEDEKLYSIKNESSDSNGS